MTRREKVLQFVDRELSLLPFQEHYEIARHGARGIGVEASGFYENN